MTQPEHPLMSGLLRSKSRCMHEIFGVLEAASKTNLTTLITGETGTGKELVARTIHSLSARFSGPFISVNCGALPRDLIESELFGHKRGAFTGASEDRAGLFRGAHRGTLFLDELAEMPLEAQSKLLRVIQMGAVRPVGELHEQAVDVRVIAATNHDLEESVAHKRFRSDLYYRLNVLRMTLPGLRERMEDLPELVEFFRERVARKHSMDCPPKFSAAALRCMAMHAWPGNLRELENAVEAAMAMAPSSEIEVEHLPRTVRPLPPTPALREEPLPTLREVERRLVADTLGRVGRNKAKAARVLGISRSRLYAILNDLPDSAPSKPRVDARA